MNHDDSDRHGYLFPCAFLPPGADLMGERESPQSGARYVEGGSDLMGTHFLEVTNSMRQVAGE